QYAAAETSAEPVCGGLLNKESDLEENISPALLPPEQDIAPSDVEPCCSKDVPLVHPEAEPDVEAEASPENNIKPCDETNIKKCHKFPRKRIELQKVHLLDWFKTTPREQAPPALPTLEGAQSPKRHGWAGLSRLWKFLCRRKNKTGKQDIAPSEDEPCCSKDVPLVHPEAQPDVEGPIDAHPGDPTAETSAEPVCGGLSIKESDLEENISPALLPPKQDIAPSDVEPCCSKDVPLVHPEAEPDVEAEASPENTSKPCDETNIKIINSSRYQMGSELGKGNFGTVYEATRLEDGTEAYVPPELLQNGWFYGEEATVWALGIILFVMVNMRYPRKQDLYRINGNIYSKEGYSIECHEFLYGCLQLNPRKRIELENLHLLDWFETTPREEAPPAPTFGDAQLPNRHRCSGLRRLWKFLFGRKN
ncbi:hypothetical protein DNTS_018784, partial [Danionella cerebrum]